MGADSNISSALPAGTPSKMSVNTTSARPASRILCAVVDPTNPPPTTVTFFRIRDALRKFMPAHVGEGALDPPVFRPCLLLDLRTSVTPRHNYGPNRGRV